MFSVTICMFMVVVDLLRIACVATSNNNSACPFIRALHACNSAQRKTATTKISASAAI